MSENLPSVPSPSVPSPCVPSPCVNICRLTADRGHCEGCFRSIEEIRAWRDLDEAGKRRVWAAIAERSGGRHTLELHSTNRTQA